jgi:putative ABC transport system permease protein
VFRFAPYLWKNLWRHRARTVLTVSGSAVALFVFCCVGAVREGLDRVTSDDASDRTLIVFQENRFCPSSSRLPQDYIGTIGRIDGVADAIPIRVYTNNCRASLDVIVFNGMPADGLQRSRQFELVEGTWDAFLARSDAALVGAAVARRRNLRAGRAFSIGEITVQVAGVFRSPTPGEDDTIYTHLDFLQRTSGAEAVGIVTQIEVRVADGTDPDALAAEIDSSLRSGPVATVTRRKSAFQTSVLADLVDLVAFAHWLGYACVGLVLSIVATTTVMAVQDRVRQHALLQTLGLRPGRIFRLILSESLLVCLAGGLVGTACALIALAWAQGVWPPRDSSLPFWLACWPVSSRPSTPLGPTSSALCGSRDGAFHCMGVFAPRTPFLAVFAGCFGGYNLFGIAVGLPPRFARFCTFLHHKAVFVGTVWGALVSIDSLIVRSGGSELDRVAIRFG